MKFRLIISILLVGMLFTACNDDTMITVVNDNGTCMRSFSADVSSAFLSGDTSKNYFPIELDSAWKITWLDSNGVLHSDWPSANFAANDSAINYKAMVSRTFNSVKEMSDSFRFKNGYPWSQIPVKSTLDKRFRWFYTYFEYKDIYGKLPIVVKVSLSNYMSEDEAGFWLTGIPNIVQGKSGIQINDLMNELETKFKNWFLMNVVEIQYANLLKNLDAFPESPGRERILADKDSLLSKVIAANREDIPNQNIGAILNEYYHTKAFIPLQNDKDSLMREIRSPSEIDRYLDYFNAHIKYKLMIPGNIISTNGIVVRDTINWSLDGYKMLDGDYIMTATSRKLNTIPCVISIFVVIAGIVLFFKRK